MRDPVQAIAGALLLALPLAVHAASGASGTTETVLYGHAAALTTGGTTSGAGPSGDGAARAEAAEQAADRDAGILPGEAVVHPRSVVHQSTAQNALWQQGPSPAANPNVGFSPSENSPSSEPIGKWQPARQVAFDRAALRIDEAAARVEAAAERAEHAADRAAQAAGRAEAASRDAEQRFTRAIMK